MLNLDPNINHCGRTANKKIRLVFGLWEYRAERTMDVGGNCSGLQNVETAIENLYEDLCDEFPLPKLFMRRADGDTLLCEDDEEREDEWLKDMLVSAEVISIEPITI